MLLVVDAGNTKIKWAVLESAASEADALGRWTASGTVERGAVGQLADAWRSVKISHALLSNVAGPAMHVDLEHVLLRASVPVSIEWFKSVSALAGVRNGYRSPGQLGCDRFAAMIGAHAMYPGQPLIVATCGTATTIDAVTAAGVFLGGMILPGLGLMATSLALNTAQLPQVARQIKSTTAFADNTDDAIANGCIAAQTGAIERAVTAFSQQYGSVRCIISGGAASMVAPHLSMPCSRVDNLVLIGLQTVFMKRNTPC